MKSKFQMMIFGMTASIALSAPAFAFHGGDMTNMSAIKQSLDTPNSIRLVRLEGALSCDLGADSKDQGCELKLHESKTGHTYSLLEAKSAMTLYLGGNKNVIIEGRLADSDTIEVKKAQTL